MSGEPVTALITGAAGFAGRHLIAELGASTSWRIVGLARRASRAAGMTPVLACDLLDAPLVARVVEHHRPAFVFHLAAQSYVPRSVADPSSTLTNNVVGQLNLLEACRRHAPDARILIVGSADEYGLASEDEMPLGEQQPFRPMNPYAVSKIAQDMLGLQYALSYGMSIVRVRPFNHFGPGQADRFVLSGFARQVAQAERESVEPVVLTGNLDARRDFLDVRDVVRAYRLAVTEGSVGEVYNIASGRSWRIGDLLDRLISLASVDIEVRADPSRMRPSDTPLLVGDASKLRAAVGWEPIHNIEETLRNTLDYWRAQLGGPGADMPVE